MKIDTSTGTRLHETDVRVPTGETPATAGARRPAKGRTFGRRRTGVVAVLAIVVIAAVVTLVATRTAVDQPAPADAPLLDQSIRARERAETGSQSPALVNGQGGLSREAGRGDEPGVTQPDSLLERSARAREHAELQQPRDSLLDRSIRGREG